MIVFLHQQIRDIGRRLATDKLIVCMTLVIVCLVVVVIVMQFMVHLEVFLYLARCPFLCLCLYAMLVFIVIVEVFKAHYLRICEIHFKDNDRSKRARARSLSYRASIL